MTTVLTRNGNQKFITLFKKHLKQIPVFEKQYLWKRVISILTYQWKDWKFTSCWKTKLKVYLRSFPLDCLRQFSAEKQRFLFRREFGVHEQSFFFFTLLLELAVALVFEVMKLYHRLQWRDSTPGKCKLRSCIKCRFLKTSNIIIVVDTR